MLNIQSHRAVFKPPLARRPGDALPELDGFLGTSGVRKCQPKHQVHQVDDFVASVQSIRPSTQQMSVAPPMPPRSLPGVVVAVSSRPPFVQHPWGMLREAIADGVGGHMPSPVSPRVCSRAQVFSVMAARVSGSSDALSSCQCGIFGHIEEAEQLKREILNKNVKPAESSWHSIVCDRHGLFVDVGAVKPSIGSAFARSQIRSMEQRGLRLVWTKFGTPEFMRGVGRSAQICSWKVVVICALHDGSLLWFEALVLDVDPSHPEGAGVTTLFSFAPIRLVELLL